MSALLWVDEAKGEAIDLGNPFTLLTVFAEMGRVAGDRYDQFADLFGVPDATMDGEDVDPAWLADVRLQAALFLSELGGRQLSHGARAVLRNLAGTVATESRDGLVKKTTTDKTGKQTTVYVRPGDDASPGDRGEYSDLGNASDGKLPGREADALAKGLAAKLPEAAKDAGLWARVKDAALTVATKVYGRMLLATPAMMRVASVLGDVFDTPADMKKFGYNPTVSSGTSSAEVGAAGDPMRNATGVSTHLATTIATHVLTAAINYARKKMGKKKKKAEGKGDADGAREFAELVAEVMAETNKALGLEGPVPAADDMAAAIRDYLAQLGEN